MYVQKLSAKITNNKEITKIGKKKYQDKRLLRILISFLFLLYLIFIHAIVNHMILYILLLTALHTILCQKG